MNATEENKTAPKNAADLVKDDAGITNDDVTPPAPPECKVKLLVFLMHTVEAMACIAARPDLIPPGFKGRKRACPVESGFDRNSVKNATVNGFSIPCNLAAPANEAIEVACKMSAWDRNALTRPLLTMPEGEAKEEATKEVGEKITAAINIQKQIPLRHYKVSEVARSAATLTETEF
jgi:hypothetical protein